MAWFPVANDLQIAQLICDDPQQGFTLLLQQYGGRIRGYLRQRFPSLDGADVQDVLTDAMLALEASFDSSRGTLPAWLLLLAHQHAVQLLRSRRTSLSARSDEEAVRQLPTRDDPLAGLISAEHLAELYRVIASLPPLERAVVEADLDEGRGVAAQQLAEQLSTTEGSIYAAHRRARKKLLSQCGWIRNSLQSGDASDGEIG